MNVTIDFIDSGKTQRGRWTKASLAAIGVSWPPRKGWKDRVVGQSISDDQAAMFLAGAINEWPAYRGVELIERTAAQGSGYLIKWTAQDKVWGVVTHDRDDAIERQKGIANGEYVLDGDLLVAAEDPPSRPAEDEISNDDLDYFKTTDFLSSYEWRKLRMEVIKAYGPTCMCCRSTEAQINVDHIKPRRKYPELALEFDNLQILCSACNHGKGNWDETDWRPSNPGQ